MRGVREVFREVDVEHLLCLNRHWMQQLAVVGFIGDIVVNDQATFDIDDTLEIIGWELRRPAIPHWS